MGVISGLFSGLTSRGGEEQGYGDSSYGADSLLGIVHYLSYQECKDIYTYWPLGKRIATALPNFAMSAERNVHFGELPPIVNEVFKEACVSYKVDNIVKQTAVYARVFGMAALYVSHTKADAVKPLKNSDYQNGEVGFNVLDPLIVNGIQISQNPLEYSYQRLENIKVNGVEVDGSRVVAVFNDLPFYLRWVPSTYNWGSPSVYQNMYGLIKSWNRCVVALERMATKAGSIIIKSRDGAVISGLIAEAARKTLNLIRNMQNDGAALVEKDADVEFFNLTGVDVVDSIVTQMNQLILMALADTPSAILLDKDLAQGFGEGSEDMKALLMAVDTFRHQILKPLYDFIDGVVLRVAFNDSKLTEILNEHKKDLNGIKDTATLRETIFKEYKFEWGNLYPETEATKLDNATKQLQNLATLQQLGANHKDLEELVNKSQIFGIDSDITLEKQDEGMGELGEGTQSAPPQDPTTTAELNHDKG